MKKYRLTFYLILAILIAFTLNIFFNSEEELSATNTPDVQESEEAFVEPIIEDRVKKVEIVEDSTYGSLMEEAGCDAAELNGIYHASEDLYDLAKIKLGKDFSLIYEGDSDELKQFVYDINSEEQLICEKQEVQVGSSTDETEIEWNSKIVPIEYEIKTKTIEGTLENSLYVDALEKGIDERMIIEFANALEWSIDFALDPRVGDKYKFIIEERYREGEYIMPGWVLAGVYENNGEKYKIFFFEESEDNIGYFDEKGNSVQKMFLKAPLSFKYISSGFTTGKRYVSAFNTSTGHRAVDYAATYGTPIRSVGDGTVTSAGWSSVGYGNLTKIRHNATYSTNYAHQSRIIVKRGQSIKQGQVIGYVGSTGFSTGPHLHYEMVKNGVKINPMNEVLPPGKPIKEENREKFQKIVDKYNELLDL